MHNADIAAAFEEIADLLAIDDANPFRVRAYRNAARTLRGLGEEARAWIARGDDLTELPGIGDDLAGQIAELVATGRSRRLAALRRSHPAGLAALLAVPGLGPRKVATLWRRLGVRTPEQLRRAALDGRVAELPGFGPTSQRRLLDALAARSGRVARTPIATAAPIADALVAHLSGAEGVDRVVVAGSYRRARDTVGDLDVLVTARRAATVMDRLVAYDEVEAVTARGPTRASVRLRSGLGVDVRVVPARSFGAALQYFTGSKAHVLALRARARRRGLKVNEYGVFRGRVRVAGDTEASVYAALDLPVIPPELREDRGELEAAEAGHLPRLVALDDLRGDTHVHTDASDGHGTLRELLLAARARGLEYVAVTEHSRRLAMAHGLDPARLARQGDAIDALNAEGLGVTLLKGIEVDILEDGSLDLPDDVLARLDVVVVAVHSGFGLSRARQTERILRALDHPFVSILAHPTGRLLPDREPYDVDMPRLVRAARARGCFLELNAHPDRLDLTAEHARLAREEGVLVAIGSDVHDPAGLDALRWGVGQARRAWLEPDDVLNTRPLAALRSLLRAAR